MHGVVHSKIVAKFVLESFRGGRLDPHPAATNVANASPPARSILGDDEHQVLVGLSRHATAPQFLLRLARQAAEPRAAEVRRL
jgi:hypothetical protein